MRTLLLVLLLVTSVLADGFDKTVRDLKADSRARRRRALDALATGEVMASTRSESDRVARVNISFPCITRPNSKSRRTAEEAVSDPSGSVERVSVP